MRHGRGYRRFGRTSEHRRALLRNLATSFFLDEKISTTIPKAKDLRPVVEKLITLGREDSLHNRRQVYSYLLNKKAVQKLFSDIAPKYKERNGGYTRITRTGIRPGDAAEVGMLELV